MRMLRNNDFGLSVDGLDEYIEKIEKMDESVDEAIRYALEKAVKPIHDDIVKWAKKHKDKWTTKETKKGTVTREKENIPTGATLAQVMEIKAVTEGFESYVELGIKGESGGWHAVFVEYGRPGFKADPGIARAFKKNKAKANKILKEVLAEWSNNG